MRFLHQGVPPPGHLYITPDDRVVVLAWTALTGVELAIDIRVLFPDGRIGSYRHRFPLAGGVAENSFEITLAEGFLLSTWIRPTGTVTVGACWVQCILQRPGGAETTQVQLIASGYVTRRGGLGWPFPRYQQPTEGSGRMRILTGTDPTPGNNSLETIPTGVRWELFAHRFTLITSARAGDRTIQLQIRSGNIAWFQSPVSAVQGPSVTRDYNYAVGIDTRLALSGLSYQDALPAQAILVAGAEILITVLGGLAADDLSPPFSLVQEWVEP